MPRLVLHVDLDQFIAAVEILRRPELAGRPVVVGGTGDPTLRGAVATASYEARRCGVRSGMALRVAARLCPDAVFLPHDRDAYDAASREVMDVLRRFPGALEVAGWDEAYLEVEHEDPDGLAREIQAAVAGRTGLSCSVGLGETKFQAKIAAGFGKPGGVFRLTGQNWEAVLGGAPPDALWGIGRKRARQLAALGITTVGALAQAPEDALSATFGPSLGPWMIRLARGDDGSTVASEPRAGRSVSRETTFQVDLTDLGAIREEVRRLARRVAQDLASEGRRARRVVAKVRFSPFVTRTHGVGLDPPGAEPHALEEAALRALGRFELGRPVRLLGVRAELEPATSPAPSP